MRDRAVIYYGNNENIGELKWMLEDIQVEYNCQIVDTISAVTFINFEKYVKENDIQYLIIACKMGHAFEDVMNAVFQSGIKAVLDAYSGKATYNNSLNKEAFSKMLLEKWEGYYRKNDMTAAKRVAIYHMSLDPIRDGCIERELEIMRVFAKRQGWEVVKEYVDLTNKYDEKIHLKEMLKETDLFDVVLLKNCYYISRSTSEYTKVKAALFRENVGIYAMNGGWC